MELESKVRWDEIEEEKRERRLLVYLGVQNGGVRKEKMRLINAVVGILASYWFLA